MCLINQYNGLVYEPTNQPVGSQRPNKHSVSTKLVLFQANGNLTLNENMADAGGLRIAYMVKFNRF